MTTILWNETVPSGQSFVAQAPAFWRSMQTSIAIGLATDLYWDGSGGASEASRGELRLGASRTYFNTSPTASVGRAFTPSNGSGLFVFDTAATYRMASPFFYEYGSAASLGWAPSNVSMFRELSGFTAISNVTTAGPRAVNIVAANFNGIFQNVSVTCSERSVAFVVDRGPLDLAVGLRSDVATINYGGLTNAPSTATFYWTCTLLTVGTNNPAGAAL